MSGGKPVDASRSRADATGEARGRCAVCGQEAEAGGKGWRAHGRPPSLVLVLRLTVERKRPPGGVRRAGSGSLLPRSACPRLGRYAKITTQMDVEQRLRAEQDAARESEAGSSSSRSRPRHAPSTLI